MFRCRCTVNELNIKATDTDHVNLLCMMSAKSFVKLSVIKLPYDKQSILKTRVALGPYSDPLLSFPLLFYLLSQIRFSDTTLPGSE